jgi:hypothetical protein
MALTAVVLVFFAIDTVRNTPETFVAIIAIALLAVVVDVVWKRARGAPGDGSAAPSTPVWWPGASRREVSASTASSSGLPTRR